MSASTEIKSSDSPLVVVDARRAFDGEASGISRFIVGLSRAITEELANRHQKSSSTNAKKPPRILFVAKHEPPTWVVEIIRKHPTLASYWSGGPGAFASDYEKPVWAWSTMSLSYIDDLSGGNFYWLAPANFDRPLLLFSKRRRALMNRVCQVIHDAIPFFQKDSMGFVFRLQFTMLVRRTLARLPRVFTVSDFSASQLRAVVSKRTDPIQVLNLGVEKVFGAKARPRGLEREQARFEFLKSLNPDMGRPENKALLEKLCGMKWVVGVGRSQKYKRWDLAQNVVAEANKRLPGGVLFIRVAATVEEVHALNDGSARPFGSGLFIANSNTLGWPNMQDNQLSELYRVSDVLMHPSVSEGFGLPPVEAALSGLPVIFSKGTAVEAHFTSLPNFFWHGVSGQTMEDWLNAVILTLNPDGNAKRFLEDLDRAPNTREFILRFSSKRFDWRESAVTFLDSLEPTPN